VADMTTINEENLMTTPQQWDDVIGLTAVDVNGDKVGSVGQVYFDEGTGQAAWVTVKTGLFGMRESFAPLYGSSYRGDQLVLAVSKQLVKDAPSIEDDGQLSEAESTALYQHYADYLGAAGQGDAGSAGSRTHADTAQGETGYTDRGTQGRDTSGPTTDEAMTRSEERLHVGTETVAAGRARLRKYVVTENVTQTVPVSHEEVRVEREPITEANRDAALSGADITEEEHEVTLRAERPVVAKETVPVERVRLGTETVTEEQQVSEQVRKEQIDEPAVESRPRDNR
jgi:uncharacterized protein (TIGR02271 family)